VELSWGRGSCGVLREENGVAEGVGPFGVGADEAISVEPIDEVVRELGYKSSHAAAPRGVLRVLSTVAART
jgi:hypothetical protein